MESDLTWKSYSKTNSSIAFDLRQQKQAATKKQKSPTRPESLCNRCRLLSFDSNAQYEHDGVTLGMPNYIAGGDMADCFGQFKNKTKWIKVKIVGNFFKSNGK